MRNLESFDQYIHGIINEKQSQIDFLKNEIEVLHNLLDQSEHGLYRPRAPRYSVKQKVLELLENVAEAGLSARSALQLAADEGCSLHLKSVSSILSRLNAQGEVFHDGERYRLSKYKNRDGDINLGVPRTEHPTFASG